MANKPMTLKEAFENMLSTAENRLALAIHRGNEWNKKHYENDIAIIKKHLEEIQ